MVAFKMGIYLFGGVGTGYLVPIPLYQLKDWQGDYDCVSPFSLDVMLSDQDLANTHKYPMGYRVLGTWCPFLDFQPGNH